MKNINRARRREPYHYVAEGEAFCPFCSTGKASRCECFKWSTECCYRMGQQVEIQNDEP